MPLPSSAANQGTGIFALPFAARLRDALYTFHHHRIHLPRQTRVARELSAQIGRAASLLDVGCGDGSIARTIAGNVGAARVEGVDILVQPAPAIPVTPYDGLHLPFPDRSFEVVVLSDMLHHCTDPDAVLREAVRVSARIVAIKDHIRFGPISNAILLAMDIVGNASAGVRVEGRYFSRPEWDALVARAGARFTTMTWPMQIHDYPFRVVTRDELQFAACIERLPG